MSGATPPAASAASPAAAAPHPAPFVWTPAHVAAIAADRATTIAPVAPPAAPLIAGVDLWDLWPLQLADGATARFDGWAVWFVLSAPALPDPEGRHDIARIRLLSERDGTWRDHGHAFPDALNPGSREWAGSARLDPATGTVTMFWTAAGFRGTPGTFAQRMFRSDGRLAATADTIAITGWSPPAEIAGGPIPHYVLVTQSEGVPGMIKGFRDPAHLRDPADGATYLLFTGSLAGSASAFNGCIGLLRENGDGWDVLPPLLVADGLNNEQERPHIVRHDGRLYLFWSTQRKVFAPAGPSGPNGLYGLVAETMSGPWRPLNGTGLVAANPDATPFQTYSWWVTADLTVHGFVDYPQVPADGRVDDIAWRRAHFGGVPAPVFALRLAGASATVAPA